MIEVLSNHNQTGTKKFNLNQAHESKLPSKCKKQDAFRTNISEKEKNHGAVEYAVMFFKKYLF